MKYISNFDFIIWDIKNDRPKEALDIVYHYTTVIELINDGFTLAPGEMFICVAELPMSWQNIISDAICGAVNNVVHFYNGSFIH
jgi:hypothetical protein